MPIEKINKILKDVFSVDPGSIDKNANFQDLATWDSMAYMMLIARIEEDFNIQLDGDEIVKLLSINQIEEVLKGKRTG